MNNCHRERLERNATTPEDRVKSPWPERAPRTLAQAMGILDYQYGIAYRQL